MDFKNLQPGAGVTLAGTISRTIDNDGEYLVKFAEGRLAYVPCSAITAATEKPLEAGDTVNVDGFTSNPGTILAISGKRAWVKWANGNEALYNLSVLYRQAA